MGHAEDHSIPRIAPKGDGKASGKNLFRAVADGTDIVLVQVSPKKNKKEAEPIRITPGDTFIVPDGFEEIDVHQETVPAPPIGSVNPPDAPPMRESE